MVHSTIATIVQRVRSHWLASLPPHAGAILLALGFLVSAGCAQQPTSMMVESLPPPSFNAPSIARPASPATPPVTQTHPHTAPTPQAQTSLAGIPGNWIPPVHERPWRWIVVHHSATAAGGAARFDKMHRAKGWDELGYDFVIGNGTDTRDGQIEVGSRWPKQKTGAHAKTPDNRFNEYGIGICLVGNFDIDRPTAAQLKSLAKLTAFLMNRYHIPPDRVIGHRDTKATDCPGRNVNLATIRRMAEQDLAQAGHPVSPEERRVTSIDLSLNGN